MKNPKTALTKSISKKSKRSSKMILNNSKRSSPKSVIPTNSRVLTQLNKKKPTQSTTKNGPRKLSPNSKSKKSMKKTNTTLKVKTSTSPGETHKRKKSSKPCMTASQSTPTWMIVKRESISKSSIINIRTPTPR